MNCTFWKFGRIKKNVFKRSIYQEVRIIDFFSKRFSHYYVITGKMCAWLGQADEAFEAHGDGE